MVNISWDGEQLSGELITLPESFSMCFKAGSGEINPENNDQAEYKYNE